MSVATWCRTAVLAGLLLALGFGLARSADGKGKKYALLVGVNGYQSTHFTNLKFAENDIEELAKLLLRPGSGFAQVRVLTTARGKKDSRDAPTATNIRKAFDTMLQDKGKHDLVLLALSGHGVQVRVKDPEDEKEPKTYTYFCPTDARLSGIKYSTGFSKYLIHLNDTFDSVGRCDAGTKLVLMDACRNELEAKAQSRRIDLRKVSIPDGVGALFSCKSGQTAFETEKLKHGVFFHFVLQGLRGQARNRDREVTWDDLVSYVRREVARQTPKLVGGGARQNPHLMTNLTESPVLIRADGLLINSIGMDLRRIPAGSFNMGSTRAVQKSAVAELAALFDAEAVKGFRQLIEAEPQHEVKISKPFYLGACEVTQQQYRRVMDKNPSFCSKDGEGKFKVWRLDTSDFPVDNVTWADAVKFCETLSALPAEKKAGRSYRLPTEAEWEYACRAGTSTVFNFGDSASGDRANFNGEYAYGGAMKGKYLGRSCKVGSYKPNAFGLYDMHGNVGEWCADWYAEDYYSKSPGTDPRGPATGSLRIVRGGAWDNIPHYGRAAYRIPGDPTARNPLHGFRVVCVVSETIP